jgi:hypothetical protein
LHIIVVCRTCTFEQLMNRTAASGKIVLCFGTEGMLSSGGAALAVYAGKGSGVIFADTITRKSSQDSFLPTVHVDLRQGTRILHYIRSSRWCSTFTKLHHIVPGPSRPVTVPAFYCKF